MTTSKIRQQVKAYREGRDQAAKGERVEPDKHTDPKVQVAYEAGHGYGETAKRNGWK